MYERFVLAVQVTHEVLGALGQTEQGLNADDLAGRGGHGLVFLRQQAQIAQMLIGILHGQDPPCTFLTSTWNYSTPCGKTKGRSPEFWAAA